MQNIIILVLLGAIVAILLGLSLIPNGRKILRTLYAWIAAPQIASKNVSELMGKQNLLDMLIHDMNSELETLKSDVSRITDVLDLYGEMNDIQHKVVDSNNDAIIDIYKRLGELENFMSQLNGALGERVASTQRPERQEQSER